MSGSEGEAHKEAAFRVLVLGAKENGKLWIDLPWDREVFSFADVIGTVIMYIEGRIGRLLKCYKAKSAGDTDCRASGSIGLQRVPSAVRLLRLRFGRCDSRSTYALVAAVSNVPTRASSFTSWFSWRRSCSAPAISSSR